MLESFVDFDEIEKRPWVIFFWSLVLTSIAILVANQLWFHINISGINVNLTGIFSVMFTVIPSVFFVTMVIKREEALEEEHIKKHYFGGGWFWQRHEKDLIVFLLYFTGVTLAFTIWSMILPGDAFLVQTAKINQIHGLTGAATGALSGASSASQASIFYSIFMNNMQVMIFAFLFSFIFGAGAVFILVWNASILGVYIGQLTKHFLDIPVVSLSFIPHGVPEIAGYIMAGLAGGLISAAVIRRHGSKVLSVVVTDAIKIMIVAFVLILLAAGIEVYV